MADSCRLMTKWRWVLTLVAAVAVGAGVGYLCSRPTVDWVEVAAAVGRQDTLHGTGRAFLDDGSEWEAALWAKIDGPGKTTPNWMVRPVKTPEGQSAVGEKPKPGLMKLVEEMDVCGEHGVVTRLAEKRVRQKAVKTQWGRKDVLEAEVRTRSSDRGGPHLWRVYVDKDSGLVRAVAAFAEENGTERVRLRCEYEYNEALPPGFREN